jgi:hypothetical protein
LALLPVPSNLHSPTPKRSFTVQLQKHLAWIPEAQILALPLTSLSCCFGQVTCFTGPQFPHSLHTHKNQTRFLRSSESREHYFKQRPANALGDLQALPLLPTWSSIPSPSLFPGSLPGSSTPSAIEPHALPASFLHPSQSVLNTVATSQILVLYYSKVSVASHPVAIRLCSTQALPC